MQRRIYGNDARIHAVRGKVFGPEIISNMVDYRQSQDSIRTKPLVVPEIIKKRIINSSRSLNLKLSGWNFKIDQKGKFWCLEVNSMPGYSGYDIDLKGAISGAFIKELNFQ